MIISHLNGGLGNQMFQYACGRSLALKNNSELVLDTAGFKDYAPGDTVRHFELSIFDLINRVQITDKPSPRGLNKLFQVLKMPTIFTKTVIVREPNHRFHPEILKKRGNLELQGYWQSEKYFADCEDEIRHDFSFLNPAQGKNFELMQSIKKSDSVSVHVRRGDYITNSNAAGFHGLCSPEYYTNARKIIESKINRPVYYIFSDDINWVRENLNFGKRVVYVNHNQGENSWEDMRLMSACRHAIIANSSFSWWGAWLADSQDRLVIAPYRWFLDTGIDTKDLIPEKWRKI